MGTRAIIKIQDSDNHPAVYLYRHMDGYPDTIISDIRKFLNPVPFDATPFWNSGRFAQHIIRSSDDYMPINNIDILVSYRYEVIIDVKRQKGIISIKYKEDTWYKEFKE